LDSVLVIPVDRAWVEERERMLIEGGAMRTIVITLVLLLAACGEKTEYQQAKAKFDACMEKNAAESVCRIEKERKTEAAMKVARALAKKICPEEYAEWDRISCDGQMYAASLRVCQDAKLQRLELAFACVKAKEPRAASPDYMASGQAERDAGLTR